MLRSRKCVHEFIHTNISIFIGIKQGKSLLDLLFCNHLLVITSCGNEVHVCHFSTILIFVQVDFIKNNSPRIIQPKLVELILVVLELIEIDCTLILGIELVEGNGEELEIILVCGKVNDERHNGFHELCICENL